MKTSSYEFLAISYSVVTAGIEYGMSPVYVGLDADIEEHAKTYKRPDNTVTVDTIRVSWRGVNGKRTREIIASVQIS